MDEIRLLRADLERLVESNGAVREKTITQRMLSYKRLKAKAEIYKDLLEMQQDQVRAAIGALEQEARALLVSDETSHHAPSIQEPPSTLFTELEAAA